MVFSVTKKRRSVSPDHFGAESQSCCRHIGSSQRAVGAKQRYITDITARRRLLRNVFGVYTRRSGVMEAWTRDFRIQCESCTAVIDLSVLVLKLDDAAARQPLNELLVDYGWLPTSRGSYCRQHAVPARHRVHPPY